MQNFTFADVAQTTLATVAFALFLLPPGYLLGMGSGLFGMRRSSASEKLLFSLLFSFAAAPILAVLLTRISSYAVTLAVFLLLALISLFTLIHGLRRPGAAVGPVQPSRWMLLGLAVAWFVLVQLSLADLQLGNRLYVSYLTYDHSVRVPFVEAAARWGVPPRNPFYGVGGIPVLRYFYYWYVLCALPMRLLGLSAKACLDASVFWSGLGLASAVPLFLKHFLGEGEHLRRKSLIGIALLGVTGLDLLPYAAQLLRWHTLIPDMEWWDTNQVTSWLGSLLWVPHHVASLVAAMAGLLVLSGVGEKTPARQMAWASAIAGVAFASAAGLSVYVTFTFALFAVFWTLVTLARREWRTLTAYAAAGIVSLALSAPYLLELLSRAGKAGVGAALAPAALAPAVAAPAGGSGDRFAFFAIRDYLPATQFFASLGVRHSLLAELLKLPVLVYVYALEFGFYALVLVLCLRRDWPRRAALSRQRQMAWAMLAVCLLAMSFLQSNTTGSNDLGFRGILVVQFVLLIWSAPVLDELFFRRAAGRQPELGAWSRYAAIGTLALGVAATAVQLVVLRVYPILADSGNIARAEFFLGAPGFGERTYWMRQGFAQLNEQTPASDVVQYNPVQSEVLISHLYSTRQAAMGDESCGSSFGGDAAQCREVLPYMYALFNAPSLVRSWDLERFCNEAHLNVLVATDADPVWADSESWVWKKPVLVANPMMRAVSCGAPSPGR